MVTKFVALNARIVLLIIAIFYVDFLAKMITYYLDFFCVFQNELKQRLSVYIWITQVGLGLNIVSIFLQNVP